MGAFANDNRDDDDDDDDDALGRVLAVDLVRFLAPISFLQLLLAQLGFHCAIVIRIVKTDVNSVRQSKSDSKMG